MTVIQTSKIDELKQAISIATNRNTIPFDIHITPEQLGRVRDVWPTESVEGTYWSSKGISEVPKRLDNVRLVLVLPRGVGLTGEPLHSHEITRRVKEWDSLVNPFKQLRPLCGGLAYRVGDGPLMELEG